MHEALFNAGEDVEAFVETLQTLVRKQPPCCLGPLAQMSAERARVIRDHPLGVLERASLRRGQMLGRRGDLDGVAIGARGQARLAHALQQCALGELRQKEIRIDRQRPFDRRQRRLVRAQHPMGEREIERNFRVGLIARLGLGEQAQPAGRVALFDAPPALDEQRLWVRGKSGEQGVPQLFGFVASGRALGESRASGQFLRGRASHANLLAQSA